VHGWFNELCEAGLLKTISEARGRTPATWELIGNDPDDGSSILPTFEDVSRPEKTREHKTKPIGMKGLCVQVAVLDASRHKAEACCWGRLPSARRLAGGPSAGHGSCTHRRGRTPSADNAEKIFVRNPL